MVADIIVIIAIMNVIVIVIVIIMNYYTIASICIMDMSSSSYCLSSSSGFSHILVLVLFINIITVCIVIVIGNIVVIMYFLYLCDCPIVVLTPILISSLFLLQSALSSLPSSMTMPFFSSSSFLKLWAFQIERPACTYLMKRRVVFHNPPLAWSCFNLTSPFPLAVKGNTPPPFGRQGEPRPLAVKANSPPPFGRQGEPPPLAVTREPPPLTVTGEPATPVGRQAQSSPPLCASRALRKRHEAL